MPNPNWEECKTCNGRDLCHGEESLAGHGMSSQTFYDLVIHDAEFETDAARPVYELKTDPAC